MNIFNKIIKYKLALAFNGGKESIIILDLAKKYLTNFNEIIFFRIIDQNEFDEINEYITFITEKYNIKMIEYKNINYKQSIDMLKKHYHVEGIILGNRKTDPNCHHLEEISETDPGWPAILRINPLINWSYKKVWEYIDENKIPVCSLYEKGYTSIGNKTNTFPNYTLFNNKQYQHAKCLQNGDDERINRIKISSPIKLQGKIIHGNQIGRKLGFPTANLDVNIQYDNICEGIYYGKCGFNNNYEEYLMVMSVGKNIHFDKENKTFEVHILNIFEKEFYGETLYVNIEGFIRRMEKYINDDILIQSIQRDIEICKYHNLSN